MKCSINHAMYISDKSRDLVVLDKIELSSLEWKITSRQQIYSPIFDIIFHLVLMFDCCSFWQNDNILF